jgi:SAM-dependent methyltransferase
MSEVTTGVRAILSFAPIYDLVQNALGAKRYRREIAKTYVTRGGSSTPLVLDVGCGTAQILNELPGCTYVGVDFSAPYIDAARRRFGERGTFVCTEATQASFAHWGGQVDCVLMLGLLHHLDDAEVLSLLRAVSPALASGGRVVTVDPTIASETHSVGRLLAQRDRGRNVRDPHRYQALTAQVFGQVTLHVRHDLLRVPYSHAILECSSPLSGSQQAPQAQHRDAHSSH